MPVAGSLVAEITARVDLLTYVSQYVTLRKRGREYVGLCPFHAEKTPSFSLNAEKQLWHCYGCQAGGDLIGFVKRYENLDFPQALRLLAARAGIPLHETPDAARKRSLREAIYEANAAARAYFADALRTSQRARAYLAQRGLEPEVCERFGVGYAPDEWEGLSKALARAGIDLGVAATAGLVSARTGEAGYVDFFRGRLMLPIYNLTGEVIAFGGRSLGDEEPKYLNTRNTPVYTKGHHVFGLHLARRSAAAHEAIIVVEGYLDCLALHQAGFTNAVASLGTALSLQQARELHRVADNLYLCFDGDAAGQAATVRSIDMLVDEGLHVLVAALPPGRDPDDVVREGGKAAFAALLDSSRDWTEFKIEQACSRIAERFTSKSEVAREALAVIARVRDPIERDLYIKAMARRLDVSESALRAVRPAVAPAAAATAGGEDSKSRPDRRSSGPRPALSVERELVQVLMVRPQLTQRVAACVGSEDFSDPEMREVYRVLAANADALARGESPLGLFTDEAVLADLTHLALAAPPLSPPDEEERLARIVARFERRRWERRLYELDAEMNQLLTAGKSVPEPLRDEYNSLAATLRGAASDKADQKEGPP